jgi:hypothetical protein
MWVDGMTAWGNWMEKHWDRIVEAGSPLGRTLRASASGIAPHENRVVDYVVVEADTVPAPRPTDEPTSTAPEAAGAWQPVADAPVDGWQDQVVWSGREALLWAVTALAA